METTRYQYGDLSPRVLRFAGALLLCSALCACAARSKPPAEKKEIELYVEDPLVTKVTAADQHVKFGYGIDNPTDFPVTIKTATYTLTVDGKAQAPQKETINVVVAPRQKTSGQLEFTIALPFQAEQLKGGREGRSIPFGIEGKFVLALPPAGPELPPREEEFLFEEKGEVVMPMLPRVQATIQASRYENMIDVQVILSITNINSFHVAIDEVSYALTVGDAKVKEDIVAQATLLKSRAGMQYDITRTIGQKDLHDLAKQLYGQKQFKAVLEGIMHLQGVQVPYRIEKEVIFPETSNDEDDLTAAPTNS